MLTIRRGKPEDNPQIQELLKHVWQDDYVPYMWLDWVNSPDQGIVLVAETEGKLIGTTYVAFRPQNTCWFQALRVHPDFRRSGVGSQLTKASIQEAKASGKVKVYLGIDSDNTASITLTERMGFSRVSEYIRLTTANYQAPQNHQTLWRPAQVEDIEIIYQNGQTRSIKELLLCWQWQPFSKEALVKFSQEGHLSVWGDGKIQVWGGLEIYEEIQLFAPWGHEEHIKEAITDAQALASQRNAERLEIWLPQDSPLANYLLDKGYAPDDGYLIWEYNLE